MIKLETKYSVDKTNNKIVVNRIFNAPLEIVWDAWTNSAMLDQWWAPKPWKAQTKKMDFKEGGAWLYCMAGPAAEKHWAGFDFLKIEKHKHFEAIDYFCDEHGNKSNVIAPMNWFNQFKKTNTGTEVEITILFKTLEDLEKIVAMGFKEGFAMGHDNLDELLNSK